MGREGPGKEMGGRAKKKRWLVSKRSPPLSSPGRSRAFLFLLSLFPFFRPSPFELRMPCRLRQVLLLTFGVYSFSGLSRLQEKRRMDSHETNLTGDDEIIVTKTIRSVSGKFVSVD